MGKGRMIAWSFVWSFLSEVYVCKNQRELIGRLCALALSTWMVTHREGKHSIRSPFLPVSPHPCPDAQ